MYVLPVLNCAVQDVSAAMQPKLRAAFSLLHLNALRVNRAAINATFATLQRRLLSVDPWLPVDTQVRPCAQTAVLCCAVVEFVYAHTLSVRRAALPPRSQAHATTCRY